MRGSGQPRSIIGRANRVFADTASLEYAGLDRLAGIPRFEETNDVVESYSIDADREERS